MDENVIDDAMKKIFRKLLEICNPIKYTKPRS